jgi:hypothetical protein
VVSPPSTIIVGEQDPIICSDAGAPENYWVDKDRDGYRGNTIGMFCSDAPPPGFVASGAEADCDDNNAAAQEFRYTDNDGDGHGTFEGRQCAAALTSATSNVSALGDDCDDENPDIFPASPAEVPLDGISTDCDPFDFATSRGPVSDQQLEEWAAQITPSEACTEGVDLFVLHVAYAKEASCLNCVEEVVIGNRGGQEANVALRERLENQLVSQIALGEIAPGGWLRASTPSGSTPGLHEFTAVEARPSAECNTTDNTFAIAPTFTEPGF